MSNAEVYIARSENLNTRTLGSSGGVVSEFILHLLKQQWYAVVPVYIAAKVKFEPRVIRSPEEYEQTGSIYHDLNLVDYLRTIRIEAGRSYVATCLPCEAKAITKIFHDANAEILTIALACSGQQSYEATELLLAIMGVKKEDVASFKYRGGGWPGGVQIETRSGKVIETGNLQFPWYDIFNSNIFTLAKCFSCQDILGRHADLVAADPWFKSELEQEKIGRTLIICRTSTIKICTNVTIDEELNDEQAHASQSFTFRRKLIQKKYKKYLSPFIKHRKKIAKLSKKWGYIVKPVRIIYSKTWKILERI
jgi:coenzyme F420 hydrogenase subunit beta